MNSRDGADHGRARTDRDKHGQHGLIPQSAVPVLARPCSSVLVRALSLPPFSSQETREAYQVRRRAKELGIVPED